MKIVSILFISIILFDFSSFCENNKVPVGIFANNDCEVVITEKYFLKFEREGENISSEFVEFENRNGDFYCKTYGFVTFSQNEVIVKAVQFNRDSLISKSCLGKIIGLDSLEINTSKKQILRKIEEIDIVKQYPFEYANKDYIYKCLIQWEMGSKLRVNEKNNSLTYTVVTNCHDYIFSINNSRIYCRAARIKANNNGMLFAQNIRLWNSADEHTCFLIRNNGEVSSEVLEINDELFIKNACTFDEIGIYWSLVSFKKKKIILNGCQEEYVYRRSPNWYQRFDEYIRYEENMAGH